MNKTTTTIPTENETYTATLTNTCACQYHDAETDEYHPTDNCYGDCWDDQVQDFANITEHLFTENNQEFRIEGFPVWYGTIDGTFHARTPEKLLESITPDRTEWNLEVTVHTTHLTGKLSHHDGNGTITVTPITQE
jgi:hypothetical protein